MKTVYCVEDDEDIRELIVYALKSSGFEADGFTCAKEFEERKKTPDLIILDIMLPDKDGIDILKELRQNNVDVPVIMLTAKSSETDKIKGFDVGADDYMTKPFSVLELVSRVKAILKRTSNTDNGSKIVHNGIMIDEESRIVKVDNEKLSLTYKEFELLYVLMKNSGKAVSREKLLSGIWGYHFDGETRTLDVHIGSLRHKLGEKGAYIETVRNIGYKLV